MNQYEATKGEIKNIGINGVTRNLFITISAFDKYFILKMVAIKAQESPKAHKNFFGLEER